MFRLISVSAIILACTGAAGCGDDPAPAPNPTPTPVQITETFSGTITVNGAATHQFTTGEAGQTLATLSSLSPDSAAIISFTLGTWNGQYCAVTLAKDDATTGANLIGNASVGSFCVRVSDVGRLTAPTDYSITVQHY
jgi:hypothetical protein